MNDKQIITFFNRLKKENPSPKTELIYHSPFELLVAVMLSAQTTDANVNKATPDLFKKANTPQAIVRLGETRLKQYIKTINYYNTKARHLIATAKQIIALHQGQVPNTREELEALPGVGRKTANVILNVAFNQKTIAVDTHIFRVANRTGLAIGATPKEVEENLLKVVPLRFLANAHHWLILFGRYTCKAKAYDCKTCIMHDLCAFNQKK